MFHTLSYFLIILLFVRFNIFLLDLIWPINYHYPLDITIVVCCYIKDLAWGSVNGNVFDFVKQ